MVVMLVMLVVVAYTHICVFAFNCFTCKLSWHCFATHTHMLTTVY